MAPDSEPCDRLAHDAGVHLLKRRRATPVHRLAQLQAQRFWIEWVLQEAGSEYGMADYQTRKWSALFHHMALVAMALLFMLKERMTQRNTYPLLSCSDIERC